MKRWMVLIVVTAAIVVFAVSRVERYPERGDFGIYYQVGRAAVAGGDLYADSHLGAGYVYPPFFALLMVPFSVMPLRVSAAAWFVINLGSVFLLFAASLYLLERPRATGMAPWLRSKLEAMWYGKFDLVLVATAAVTCRFWLHGLRWCNINALVWAISLLGVYFAFTRKRTVGGALLGVAVATKVMTAPVLLFLLLRKEYRAVVCAAAVVAALYLLPAAAFGWARNAALLGEWYERVLRAGAVEYYFYVDDYNQSLGALGYAYAKWFSGGEATEFLTAKRLLPIYNWATRAVLGSFVAVAAFKCLRPPTRGDGRGSLGDCLLLSIIILSGLLLQPLTWSPYYVGTVFPYMTVLYALRVSGRGVVTALGYALVGLSFVGHTMAVTDLWGPAVDEFGYRYKIITWGVLALYAAVVVLVFRFSRRPAAADLRSGNGLATVSR
jgi:hypothetical protein